MTTSTPSVVAATVGCVPGERSRPLDPQQLGDHLDRLYRAALAAGLPPAERVQAVIQLASTIRNLDRAEESLALLEAEAEGRADDEWTPALAAFTALALAGLGRDREAAITALRGLIPSLPRYHRSVTAYTQELADGVR